MVSLFAFGFGYQALVIVSCRARKFSHSTTSLWKFIFSRTLLRLVQESNRFYLQYAKILIRRYESCNLQLVVCKFANSILLSINYYRGIEA